MQDGAAASFWTEWRITEKGAKDASSVTVRVTTCRITKPRPVRYIIYHTAYTH